MFDKKMSPKVLLVYIFFRAWRCEGLIELSIVSIRVFVANLKVWILARWFVFGQIEGQAPFL